MSKTRNYRKIGLILVFLLSFIDHSSFAQSNRAFSKGELANFNGQNGKPAYVAVKGTVYDVTHVQGWTNGQHFCRNAIAGKDLTAIWNLAPRSHQNPAFLSEFPVVGHIAAKKASNPSPTVPINKRIFTLNDLAHYNGKNGKPAYVGVKGKVYDVTRIPEWVGGKHYCRDAVAGKDLTPLWSLAPRSHQNPGFLKAYPLAGTLMQGSAKTTASPPKGPSTPMIVLAGLFIAFMITGAWLFFQLLIRRH